jgi:hypothetical protein
MEAQFQEMFKKIAEAAGEVADSNVDPSLPAGERATAGGSKAFQDKIRETMARMETGGKQATEAAVNDGSEDFMAEILKQMGGSALGEGGEDFDKFLSGMMEQLVTKEILYQPMKDLDDQFPPWLEKNKEKVSKEDMERYTKQRSLVAEIVAKFEESTYSDSNNADRTYVTTRMEQVCNTVAVTHFMGKLGALTPKSRCKLAARLPPIWLGTWEMPLISRIYLMTDALLSEPIFQVDQNNETMLVNVGVGNCILGHCHFISTNRSPWDIKSNNSRMRHAPIANFP